MYDYYFCREDSNVIQRLTEIANKCIKQTGIYFSHPPLHQCQMNPDEQFSDLEKQSAYGGWKK